MYLTYLYADGSEKDYFRSLNRACYEDVVCRQFGSWEESFEAENFEKKWCVRNFQKIYLDGDLVGAIWVDEHVTHLRIREIQIHPEFQNRGIGTLAIKDVVARAAREKKRLRLHVLHQNKAVKLYTRLGFSILDETGTQYIMEYT